MNDTYSIGSASSTWKDLFVGPGSIYVNGQEVLHTDPSKNVNVTADTNQDLIFQTAGTGDLQLNPTGVGNILLKGNVQLSAGKTFRTSNGDPLLFSDGIQAGNLALSANALTAANTNGSLALAADGLGAVYVTHGNFGIGTTSPMQKLTVAGDGLFTGDLTAGGSLTVDGTSVTNAGKNKLSVLLADSNGPLLVHQTDYWNGSAFVATDGYGLGENALGHNSGYLSNGFGYQALYNNTGTHSNGFGSSAFYSNTGNYSNGFGYYALENNTGDGSNGFGANVLLNNTGQSSNGFGNNALGNNTGSAANGFGVYALGNNTGGFSSGFSNYALQYNTGQSSNGFGNNALQNNTGDYSNGFGSNVLKTNTGEGSNGFGYEALQNNSGDNSNGFGYAALFNNTGNYSNGFGYAALEQNTGANAVGIGHSALYDNQGSGNTAIGYGAGSRTSIALTGGNNTFLGANTNYDSTTPAITNSTAVGANVTLTNSNTVILGNGASIGIGTTTPSQKLSVAGDGLFTGDLTTKGDFTTSGGMTAGGALTVSGNVGINQSAPSNALDVYSTDGTKIFTAGKTGGNNFFTSGQALTFSTDAAGMTFRPDTYLSLLSNSQLWLKADANIYFQRSSDSADLMFINTTTGNVGIGTTSPFAKLTVAGGDAVVTNGAICADNGGTTKCQGTLTPGTVYADSSSFTASDIAENYPVADRSLSAGDVVAINADGKLVKAGSDDARTVIGIVSTAPGVLLGDSTGTSTRPVALVGRVPVEFSDENGDVKPGDLLTVSKDNPGMAMKATSAGTVIGTAMDASHGSGTVTAFVNITWGAPNLSLSDYDLEAKLPSDENWLEQAASFITDSVKAAVGYFQSLFVGNLHVENELCVGDTCVNEAQLKDLLDQAKENNASDTPTDASGEVDGSGSDEGGSGDSGNSDSSTATTTATTTATSTPSDPTETPDDTVTSTTTATDTDPTKVDDSSESQDDSAASGTPDKTDDDNSDPGSTGTGTTTPE